MNGQIMHDFFLLSELEQISHCSTSRGLRTPVCISSLINDQSHHLTTSGFFTFLQGENPEKLAIWCLYKHSRGFLYITSIVRRSSLKVKEI